MACRSYGPYEGRIDRAHGAAAVTKERQGPPTLAAEPLRASLARSDRNIVRTETISISRPRACLSRSVGGIREITGNPGKYGDFVWQFFCTTPRRASLTPREGSPSLHRGRTHNERAGRRAEHCGEHRRVAHLEHPCEARSR